MASGQVEEYCREWVESKANNCGKVADFILWGKLFPKAALGPRCYDHAERHIGGPGMSMLDQWAVYDLRRVREALAAAIPSTSLGAASTTLNPPPGEHTGDQNA